jgi:hypothetical protein
MLESLRRRWNIWIIEDEFVFLSETESGSVEDEIQGS